MKTFLKGQFRTTTVVRILYGDVSAARLEREQADVNYRAQQLAPFIKVDYSDVE